MENSSVIFLKVAQNKIPVSALIDILITKDSDLLDPSTKFAFQAFCCALLAKEAKGFLQKRQYVKEYWDFIQQSLLMTPDSIEGHLVRLMVEKQLENVNFLSHIQEDNIFLSEVVNCIQDPAIKELTEKILSKRRPGKFYFKSVATSRYLTAELNDSSNSNFMIRNPKCNLIKS